MPLEELISWFQSEVTAADVFMPLAVGLGLGILHAQITAYDPQHRTRTSSSRRVSGSVSLPDSVAVPESSSPPPPQSTVAVEITTVAAQTQSNVSNHAGATTQSCLSSETATSNHVTKDKAISLFSSGHIPVEINHLDDSPKASRHQPAVARGNEVTRPVNRQKAEKSHDSLTEGSEGGDGLPEDLTPTGYRRRALSLKLAPRNHGKLFCSGGGGSQTEVPHERKSSSGAGNDADVESDQEAYEGELQYCLRKRSASLSPDFCLSVSTTPVLVSPLEQKIKHFKEAKMRGVTDPEVFAGYQLKQLASGSGLVGQQSSPPSKWKTRLSRVYGATFGEDEGEGDEESGAEEAEFTDEHEDVVVLNEFLFHGVHTYYNDIEVLRVLFPACLYFPRSMYSLNPSLIIPSRFISKLLICEYVYVGRLFETLLLTPMFPTVGGELSHDCLCGFLFYTSCDVIVIMNSNSNDDLVVSSVKLRNGDRIDVIPLASSNEDSPLKENQGEPRPPEEKEEERRGEEDDLETNDTFTSRRRQRAKFLKLFFERASHHRHQQRGTQQVPRLLTGSIGLPEEAYEPSFVDDVVAASESGLHHHPLSLTPTVASKASVSNTTVVATCRRNSSAAQKRAAAQAVRTKVVNLRKKNLSMDSVSHPASETEYERMNSDVRSEYDSSSGSEDEQSALREGAPRLSTSAQSPPPLDPDTAHPSGHHQHRHRHLRQQKLQQLHVRTSGLDDAVGGGGSSGGGATNTSVRPVDAKLQTNSAQDPDVGGDSGNDDNVGPFALWYLHTLQGFSDSSCVPLETVCCYVWEGKKVKKLNFTLLDIGWRIIQAVERQTVSMFYPKLSCIVAILLAVLPLLFHAWYQQSPSQTYPRFTPSSVAVGPLPVAEMGRVEAKASRNPLDTPGTLVVFLYQWVADFVTHLFFASSDGLVDKTSWLQVTSLDNVVIGLGIWLRLNIYVVIFFLLSVAERSFQQRLLYAKHFFALTSSHRARRCRIPHLRLNKVAHVKCWLTLRSYLKKRGPQRSIECIITATFYLAFAFGLFFCARFLISNPSRRGGVFSSLAVWDILAYTAALSFFLLRFLTLGTKITKKFRNVSILITEQMNLSLCMNRKPHKKEELSTTNQVLKLAESLLKEVDGPYRICGWAVNPLIYNVFKLVLLSCFSAFISEILGFKLKLYKLKLNPANW
ncbi:Putative homeodomain transcription factor [Echinococcus granulosus]|uniref:Homeodomain transcription factor n=1 Tax=Echinococcus granulosus TaxID=6210 RepID=W6UC14_ECHGR|nr:Putative homeodomain transcription factor [Echinococcus granulosus]EUB58690.1 Putative homeodomain transcription factor [Echinococcus granulosus]